MKECFEITKSFEPMCKQVCTEEEYFRMKKAFFEKEQNLRRAEKLIKSLRVIEVNDKDIME